MASKNDQDSKPPKRRVGRKRLPPLAPGPSLQFVVASHPEEFKADDTMRHVRSHVMYKQQKSRSPRPHRTSSAPKEDSLKIATPGITRTSSPFATCSDGYLEEHTISDFNNTTPWGGQLFDLLPQPHFIQPVRALVTQLLSTITSETVQSAPAVYEHTSEYPFPCANLLPNGSLDELKRLYVTCSNLGHDRDWMSIVCSSHISFLSAVTADCVYQDVSEGLVEDSALTVYAKSKALNMIKERVQNRTTAADDFTALGILHLLISEIGDADEDFFNVHYEGLGRLVYQRGGLANMAQDGRVASLLLVIVLTFAGLRGHDEPAMVHGFFPPSPILSASPELLLPLSPFFAPSGDISALYSHCSNATYELAVDMYEITCIFLGDSASPQSPQTLTYTARDAAAVLDTRMQQIYTRLLLRPPSEVHGNNMEVDWVYESCRLASLIYCRSLVQGVSFSDSGNVIHAQVHTSASKTPTPAAGTTVMTLTTALRDAVRKTDSTNCWGDLYGLFLWVSLVGGAAIWLPVEEPLYATGAAHQDASSPLCRAWTKKYFSLLAVKGSLRAGFRGAAGVAEALRRMVVVQRVLIARGRKRTMVGHY